MSAPEGWRINEGRSNSGTSLFSPLWPHGGEDGDLIYATAKPAGGWHILVRYGGRGVLQGSTLSEVLTLMPDELRDEILVAQRRMEEIAKENALTWIARRRRYTQERRELASVWA